MTSDARVDAPGRAAGPGAAGAGGGSGGGPGPGSGGEPRLPELGALGLARFAWRQLTSMRTALLLLVLLAVAAVPGSVLPQRSVDANAVAEHLRANPATGEWLDRLGLYDVYSSVWFSAIYLLLFVSLVGCVLPRSRQHWQALRSRPPRTPRRLDRLPEHRTLVVDAPPAEVLAAARGALRRRFRVDVRPDRPDRACGAAGADTPVPDGAGGSVAAERGHLRETGNLVFHLSLVGLLVAVATGGLLGYRGQVLVPVGQGFASSLAAYDTFDPGTWFDPVDLPPFRFTVDDLQVTFEESAGGNQFGQPRDFEAALTVVPEPGAAPERVALRVNEPLDVGGAHVYLAGNGYAPVLTVRDGNGDVAFSGPVPFLAQDAAYTSTGVLKVPDALPEQIGLQGVFAPTAAASMAEGVFSIFPDARDPRLLLTAWTGDLGLDTGVPQSVYVLDTDGLTQLEGEDGGPFRAALRPGESVALPGGAGTVAFEEVRRFAGLTVRHDPGKEAALLFAVLAMAGLVVSLFVPRRRVWVRASPEPGGTGRTLVEVGALARGEDGGLAREADDLVTALSGRDRTGG